jgi:hypothetical protein
MAIALTPRPTWTLRTAFAALDATLAAWRYAASPVGRDPRLDLLRGFCVFAMVVDHVGGSSWLYALTGGNRGPVTAAEGFVFLSGLVLGIVSRQRVLKAGIQGAMRSTLSRAWTLYWLTVALTLVFVSLTVATNLSLWVDRSLFGEVGSWSALALAVAKVQFTWHGTDILALYALLLLAAPLAILLLAWGQWRVLLAGSWLLWLAYQIAPERTVIPWTIEHAHNFPVAAWQALFVSALTLGYHRKEIAAWAHDVVHNPSRSGLTFRLGLGAAAICLVMLAAVFDAPSALAIGGGARPATIVDPFDKASLGIGRLLFFAGTASIIYLAVTLLWRPVEWTVGWLLIPLGQASLYAYTVHLFLIVAAYNVPPHVGSDQPGWELHNTVGQLLLVLVVWAMVKRGVLFRFIPR